MRTSWKVAAMALLLVLGVSVGFGWGTATHVWFADKLGVQFGPLNQNEIYGSVLPDLFGYEFQSMPALTADYVLHTEGDLFWALYGSSHSPDGKAAVYGMFTHSNAPTIKGADWYAHGDFPYGGSEKGWVILQGEALTLNSEVRGYVDELLPGNAEAVAAFLPVVGHTLIETAVDILLRRTVDPLVGARLYLAAKSRNGEIQQVLSEVIGSNPLFPSKKEVHQREAAFRDEMMQYGQLFLLPDENQLIGVLSQQTAIVAQAYLQLVVGVIPAKEIDPARIGEFIQLAMQQVGPLYEAELTADLQAVKTNLESNAPPPAGPVFAFWGKERVESEFGGIQSASTTPVELALDQNYPNPFNPTTTIAFALPSDRIVSLKIYNTIGQEVATLVNEFKTAGRYSAVWDATGVPSGIYFCRLQAGNVVDTKKMTLLK